MRVVLTVVSDSVKDFSLSLEKKSVRRATVVLLTESFARVVACFFMSLISVLFMYDMK